MTEQKEIWVIEDSVDSPDVAAGCWFKALEIIHEADETTVPYVPKAELDALKAELDKLEGLLSKIAINAHAGLCQFGVAGKHEFLRDIQLICCDEGFDIIGQREYAPRAALTNGETGS